jgi:hypothetical protein
MSLKVIFLDCDGVLNSEETCEKWHKETGGNGFGGFFHADKEPLEKSDTKWGEELVDRVRRIVDTTGAQIVMSSTWRRHYDIPKFKEMFKLYGWDAPIISMTPRGYRGRGLEINMWLKDNPVDNYLILDDVDQFLVDQKPHYVQTDMMTGITEEDTERAIKILQNEL